MNPNNFALNTKRSLFHRPRFFHRTTTHSQFEPQTKKGIYISRRMLVFSLLTFLLILVLASAGVYLYVVPKTKPVVAHPPTQPVIDTRVPLNPALKTQQINKNFSFPLLDTKGKKLSDFGYSIEKVEERNDVVIKGQKATAIAGKRFVVVYLSVVNNYEKPIQIKSQDYMRLQVGSTVPLAPDLYNDPFVVQSQSSKPTELGFTIDDTVKNMQLMVGEINGKKTTIDIHF